MKVVSNTSPLCYLVLIDEVDVLPQLFDEILIPDSVQGELLDKRAPSSISQWIRQPPSWLSVEPVSASSDPHLLRLHSGERDAIQLALDCSAQLILLDDKAARHAAKERKLDVAGLLGVLVTAAERGFVDLVEAIDKLRQTNFRASPSLLQAILKER